MTAARRLRGWSSEGRPVEAKLELVGGEVRVSCPGLQDVDGQRFRGADGELAMREAEAVVRRLLRDRGVTVES